MNNLIFTVLITISIFLIIAYFSWVILRGPEKEHSKCWVIERHSPKDAKIDLYHFWTFQGHKMEPWTGNWRRAIKFFDRESAEIVTASLPDYWHVQIVQYSKWGTME